MELYKPIHPLHRVEDFLSFQEELKSTWHVVINASQNLHVLSCDKYQFLYFKSMITENVNQKLVLVSIKLYFRVYVLGQTTNLNLVADDDFEMVRLCNNSETYLF